MAKKYGDFKILILGSHYTSDQGSKRNIIKRAKIKVANHEQLEPIEQLFYLSVKLKPDYCVYIGLYMNEDRKNLFHRIFEMMLDVHMIIILLDPKGQGVLVEHGMCLDKRLRGKTYNYYSQSQKSDLSGFIKYGTLAHFSNSYEYSDWQDLYRRILSDINNKRLDIIFPKSITIDETEISKPLI